MFENFKLLIKTSSEIYLFVTIGHANLKQFQTMDVKKVTFSPILLPFAEEESSEYFIFIRKNVLAILANFIPEESVNFGSFFLEVMEQVPDSSSMPGRKFLEKTARGIFPPKKMISGTFTLKRKM